MHVLVKFYDHVFTPDAKGLNLNSSARPLAPIAGLQLTRQLLFSLFPQSNGGVGGGGAYSVDGLEEKIRRLESDKESLILQVSVLTDQVEAQGEKIRELEGGLASKKDSLIMTEDMLQHVSMIWLISSSAWACHSYNYYHYYDQQQPKQSEQQYWSSMCTNRRRNCTRKSSSIFSICSIKSA